MTQQQRVPWWHTITAYLDARGPLSMPARQAIDRLRSVAPQDITTALAVDVAQGAKSDTTDFFLFAIEHALADHALADEEVSDLTALRRYFRIGEGDLLAYHPETVSRLLFREVEVLLSDAEVDQREALHKVRLQEVLGLGYDEFLAVISPAADALRAELAARLASSPLSEWLGREAEGVRRRLAAVDLVLFLDFVARPSTSRAGYIYLLINPSMPDLVKVGRTSKTPSERAAELASATGVPTPFIVAFEVAVSDCVEAEAFVHRRLGELGYRVSNNREFFAVEPATAIRLMIEATSDPQPH